MKSHWKAIAVILGIGMAVVFFGWGAVGFLLKGQMWIAMATGLVKAVKGSGIQTPQP